MPDSPPLAGTAEPVPELRPVIADDKPWRSAFPPDAPADQSDHVRGRRPAIEHAQRQQLSRIPVEHGRNFEPIPEHAQLGEINVPHRVR